MLVCLVPSWGNLSYRVTHFCHSCHLKLTIVCHHYIWQSPNEIVRAWKGGETQSDPHQDRTCTALCSKADRRKLDTQALWVPLLLDGPGHFCVRHPVWQAGTHPASKQGAPGFSQSRTHHSEAGRSFCFIFFNRFLLVVVVVVDQSQLCNMLWIMNHPLKYSCSGWVRLDTWPFDSFQML